MNGALKTKIEYLIMYIRIFYMLIMFTEYLLTLQNVYRIKVTREMNKKIFSMYTKARTSTRRVISNILKMLKGNLFLRLPRTRAKVPTMIF